MFRQRETATEIAERELKSILHGLIDSSTHEHIDDTPTRLFEAIQRFVDTRIEDAVRDLDDRINHRGMYDPDY